MNTAVAAASGASVRGVSWYRVTRRVATGNVD